MIFIRRKYEKDKIWMIIAGILLIVIIILGYILYSQRSVYAATKENDYNKAFYEDMIKAKEKTETLKAPLSIIEDKFFNCCF